MSGTKISTAINRCIAQGVGATEMSQNLKEFAMGGHHTWSRNKIREKLGDGYARKYGSGGLDYEALRLARTTLTHQAQIAVINSSKINPYLQFVKWHSDHQAGRTCQQCIDRDGQLFKIDEVPLDHPNGMCWIQPVYSIDGKTEATPEEIAKDMKAWAAGEKNSKRMDKIPEYKGLGGTKKPAKVEKVNTYNKLTDQEIEQWKQCFIKDMRKKSNKEYVNEAAEVLKNYPPHIQQAYYKTANRLAAFWETSSNEAYYNGPSRVISMDAKKELKNIQKYKYGKFDVWFHEDGHAMDDLLTMDSNGMKHGVISANTEFINALYEDFENSKKRLYKQYQAKYNLSNSDMANKFKNNKDYTSLFQVELVGDHKTKGLQDIIEGLTNTEIRLGWGHGKAYWNRDNRNNEVASEAWANILGSYSDKQTFEYMQEYFPKSIEVLNKLIKNNL